MTDELNLEDKEQQSVPVARVNELSKKVKEKTEEAEANATAKAEAEARASSAEKERDFYASFADSASQYPQAKDFKDDIKAKVMSGYSVEDATVAVLAKNGKLTMQSNQDESVAGGSATTSLNQGGKKELKDMTSEDKLNELKEAELRGDISFN